MADTIGVDDIRRMIRSAAEKIRANRDELSKLDSAIGDGDHGTTIARAMGIAEKVIDAPEKKELKGLFKDVGWGVMGVDGGATGPLLGSFLMGLSNGIGEQDTIDCPTLAAMFEAGLAGVRRQSKAQIGDKTMMDALLPAVAAMRQAAEEGKTIKEALQRAASSRKRCGFHQGIQGPFRARQESRGSHHWIPGPRRNLDGSNFSGIPRGIALIVK